MAPGQGSSRLEGKGRATEPPTWPVPAGQSLPDPGGEPLRFRLTAPAAAGGAGFPLLCL